MILESPPLVNVTPLTAIHEVPIHIRHPIQPNSASKHRRMGLLMLNELTRVEMLVARLEAAGKHEDTSAELKRTVAHLEQTLFAYELEKKPAGIENSSGRMLLQRYMTRTGLDEMFPKSSEYLGIDPVIPGGSFIEAHFRQMSSINQLVSIALQVQNDLRLSNHKFIAHQVALLYVKYRVYAPVKDCQPNIHHHSSNASLELFCSNASIKLDLSFPRNTRVASRRTSVFSRRRLVCPIPPSSRLISRLGCRT